MNKAPTVSLVMPVFNVAGHPRHREYLGVAVHSVLAQDHDDWELIAVNDGDMLGAFNSAVLTTVMINLVTEAHHHFTKVENLLSIRTRTVNLGGYSVGEGYDMKSHEGTIGESTG